MALFIDAFDFEMKHGFLIELLGFPFKFSHTKQCSSR